MDVSVELHRDSDIDMDVAAERIEAGMDLSHAEIGGLIRPGEIDGEDLPRDERSESSREGLW